MELINQGYNLMIIGMATVFGFLIIMICTMNICSRFLVVLNKYFPEQKEEQQKKTSSKDNDAEIAVAIACTMKRGA